jgi:hypothetical protein
MLVLLVKRHGQCHWQTIASSMPGRTARQCRDRFTNYLVPNLSQAAWSPEEDRVLLERFRELGPHWSRIAPFLPGRSSNAIKNRWYTYLRRKNSKRFAVSDAAPEEPPASEQPDPPMCRQIECAAPPRPVAENYPTLSMLLNP